MWLMRRVEVCRILFSGGGMSKAHILRNKPRDASSLECESRNWKFGFQLEILHSLLSCGAGVISNDTTTDHAVSLTLGCLSDTL